MELHYFDYDGGRGPICRIALHASGLRWRDVRVSDAEFAAAKARGLYTSGLPVLKLPSGKFVTQSAAIARFAAKHGGAGLYPADMEAALFVDELVDIAADALAHTPGSTNEAEKAILRTEYAAKGLRGYMDALSNALAASGGPFVSGARLTIGDLAVDGVVSMIASGDFDHIPPEYVKDWPQLVAACRRVSAHALVKSYYSSVRPAIGVSVTSFTPGTVDSIPYTMLGMRPNVHGQVQRSNDQNRHFHAGRGSTGTGRWWLSKMLLAVVLAMVMAALRRRPVIPFLWQAAATRRAGLLQR
jgi:glutathione S-transferase